FRDQPLPSKPVIPKMTGPARCVLDYSTGALEKLAAETPVPTASFFLNTLRVPCGNILFTFINLPEHSLYARLHSRSNAMAEKILIVDDDVDTLRLVGLMLQRQGYQISAATNGEQGLAKAFEEKPDIILLDVMMPDMDGYEVARRLRKNPATQTTPILMFTAKTQLDDKVTGFEAGADDYLTKPTHPAELQAHIRALLSRVSPKKTEELDTASHEHHGCVIGILAARGGLGVSTLAANLAGALFSRTHADIILAE